MSCGSYPDPDEVFKTDSEVDDGDDSYTPSKCSDEFCDKRSWCDGNHSYSMETLKARGWGIFADLPSDDERWFSRPPLYREDDDEVVSKPKVPKVEENSPIKSPLSRSRNSNEGDKMENLENKRSCEDGDKCGDNFHDDGECDDVDDGDDDNDSDDGDDEELDCSQS